MDRVRLSPALVIAAAMTLAAGCAMLWSSATGSARAPGRRVVSAKCSACHPTPEEGSLTAVQFDKVLTVHARRVQLSAEERAALRSYLVTDDGGQPQQGP